MMASARRLIVNADDFGQSPGVTRGIIEAFEHGIVTSTSLMVRWPAAAEAATYALTHPALSIGLHLDLAEYSCRDGDWFPVYEVVPPDDANAVEAEMYRQLDLFRSLMKRDPTHIDSHQHAHRENPVRAVAIAMARELGVPLRHFERDISYCGDFYGQADEGEPFPEGISPDALRRVISTLPLGTTELACHPGFADDLLTLYRDERSDELRSLCDPSVREAILAARVELLSFASWARDPSTPLPT